VDGSVRARRAARLAPLSARLGLARAPVNDGIVPLRPSIPSFAAYVGVNDGMVPGRGGDSVVVGRS
jgi:hypothetical protein